MQDASRGRVAYQTDHAYDIQTPLSLLALLARCRAMMGRVFQGQLGGPLMNAIVIVALIGVFPPAPHTKAKNAEAARASQKRIMDEAAARHKAEMERWHGTKIGVRRSGVLLPDTIALHERVADIFTKADPPAPAGRAKQFARYLEKDAGFRCVGYGGTVESVTPNADGYLVEIFITPKLMSKFANVAFTSATSVEVWQLGKDGSLTNRTCKPHLTRLDIAMGD